MTDTEKREIVNVFVEAGAPAMAEKYAREFDLAKAALERADAQELFVLYERAVRKQGELLKSFNVLLAHYVGGQDTPRFAAPSDSTEAMKVVSLAAIDLARAVALHPNGHAAEGAKAE